jgi:hypothetical protein
MQVVGGPGWRRGSCVIVPSAAIVAKGGQLGPGRRWAAAGGLGGLEAEMETSADERRPGGMGSGCPGHLMKTGRGRTRSGAQRRSVRCLCRKGRRSGGTRGAGMLAAARAESRHAARRPAEPGRQVGLPRSAGVLRVACGGTPVVRLWSRRGAEAGECPHGCRAQGGPRRVGRARRQPGSPGGRCAAEEAAREGSTCHPQPVRRPG